MKKKQAQNNRKRGLVITISLFFLFVKGVDAQDYMNGVDLSYVNEMEDCGIHYKENDVVKDVCQIFADHGAQVFRYRLWHTPDWTDYSTFEDVCKSLSRAKAVGVKVLLDFHYSDDWADPGRQDRPAVWNAITDIDILADSVYNYTYKILNALNDSGLVPGFVQIGNETNRNIMVGPTESVTPIDWVRNVKLFNAGINAVQDIEADLSVEIKTVIHYAGPQEANWWFTTAQTKGLAGYDIIGLSYYPNWHDGDITTVGNIVNSLKTKFSKDVIVAETGNPWTSSGNDGANNTIGTDAVLPGYPNPPTPEGQKSFLVDLAYSVISNGGLGVVYWEPAWVSSPCSTRWGTGSHYENCTFFDFNNNLLPAIDFLGVDYSQAKPADTAHVVFSVDMTNVDTTSGVWVTGDFTGTDWQFIRMKHRGEMIFSYETYLTMNSTGAYIFTQNNDWDMAAYHELVPTECAPKWGTHREYLIDKKEIEYSHIWSTCLAIGEEPDTTNSIKNNKENFEVGIFPNPAIESVVIRAEKLISSIKVFSIDGVEKASVQNINKNYLTLPIGNLPSGYYIVEVFGIANNTIGMGKLLIE